MKNRNDKSYNAIRSTENDAQFIARINQIIMENMNVEGFGVPVLCKKASISRSQLHVKLKSLTNRSASHYIRFVRIEKACQLLRETNLNVSNISLEIGIRSLSYFSRIFSEEMGMNPVKYRKIQIGTICK